MKATQQLVRHIPSGEVFAHRHYEDGRIYSSIDLHDSELDLDLDSYEYDAEITDEYNAGEWRVIRSDAD